MKYATVGLCFLTLSSSFVGCQTKQGTGALAGAGGGAALGAIIGAIAGHGKGAAIGAAIGGAVGAGAGAIIGRHMDKVAEEAKSKVPDAKVEEVTDANGLKAVKVTFDSGILFATGKANLSTASKNSLANFSTVLKNNPDCYVDIYGYTDITGGDGINIPLSGKRAESVRQYLNSCGVPGKQIQNVQGKGSADPVGDNNTAAGRQLNRRVEVYLYASEALVEKANNNQL